MARKVLLTLLLKELLQWLKTVYATLTKTWYKKLNKSLSNVSSYSLNMDFLSMIIIMLFLSIIKLVATKDKGWSIFVLKVYKKA